MSVELLTEHRLEFLSLKGGCTGSSENATLCRGSIYDILASSRCVRYAGWYIHISKKRKNSDKFHKSSFSCMQCAVSCSSSFKLFLSCKPMKRRHSYAIMFCVLSPLSCAKGQSHRVLPSLKTTTTRGLIVGFFDLKHMSVNHYPVLLSAADILLAVLDPAPPPPPPQDFFSGQYGPRSGPTKCLMFCSRNKGADKTACAVCRLIFACNKVGVHTFTYVW